MKHIESILSEYAADELTRFLSDDATILSALKDLLHRDTGCDIPSLDDTSISEIEEIIPLCLSILRRFWNTPLTALGDGANKKSLAEIFRKLIGERVRGNETYSIPSANGSISDVVSALEQRDMSSGLVLTLADGTTTSLPDGLSLAQLLCSAQADNVTKIKDSNKGWVMDKAMPSILPSITDVELGCGLITSKIAVNLPIQRLTLHSKNIQFAPSNSTAMIDNLAELQHIEFPELVTADFGGFGYLFRNCPKVLSITFPEMESISVCNDSCLLSTTLEEFIAPNLSKIKRYNIGRFLQGFTALRKVVVKHAPIDRRYYGEGDLKDCPNLIHLEFAEGMNKEIYVPYWSPTNVLSDPALTEQFLYNFQHYIAERVVDMTGKTALTLTLSAEVYSALQAQSGQTILATLTNKNWTVASA